MRAAQNEQHLSKHPQRCARLAGARLIEDEPVAASLRVTALSPHPPPMRSPGRGLSSSRTEAGSSCRYASILTPERTN